MKRTVKVLQLASFNGNIGDNANHMGTRFVFARYLPYQFEYTPLEIREFFWEQRQWDEDLIRYINEFDLLMIGGGNYFELWVSRSRTGCSIDLPPALLQRITCPILFYGLGVDAGQGVPDQCREHFSDFFSAILDNDRCLVAVRNDGALETLRQYFPEMPLGAVVKVPDGGFYYAQAAGLTKVQSRPNVGQRTVVLNLAGDMLETRFPPSSSDNSNGIDYDTFNLHMANLLTSQLRRHAEHTLVLVPHIWRDLEAIFRLLELIPDDLRRSRIRVAPYITGYAACNELFRYYFVADVCLSTRFHANVCPIAMGTPTIALANYSQIHYLYRELSLTDQLVTVNEKKFCEHLEKLFENAISFPECFRDRQARVMSRLDENCSNAMAVLENWLDKTIK